MAPNNDRVTWWIYRLPYWFISFISLTIKNILFTLIDLYHQPHLPNFKVDYHVVLFNTLLVYEKKY